MYPCLYKVLYVRTISSPTIFSVPYNYYIDTIASRSVLGVLKDFFFRYCCFLLSINNKRCGVFVGREIRFFFCGLVITIIFINK